MDSRKTIEWFKDDNKIELDDIEEVIIENCTQPIAEYDESEPCSMKRIYFHENNSMSIFASNEEDLGEYKCVVNTGVESPLMVYHSYYGPSDWMWLIILIAIIIAILVLILCILCIICCRKRATKNGTYDVHPDEDDGRRQKKSSKVRIYYSKFMIILLRVNLHIRRNCSLICCVI